MFEPIVDSVFISSTFVHVAIFIVSFILFVCYLTKKDSRICKHYKAFTGPPSVPIFGNALSLIGPHENVLIVLNNWVKQYGYCLPIWIGKDPYVMMGDPNDVEKILSSTVHINKGKDYEQFLEPWLGTGLLTAQRQKWFHRRKMLTPSFHFKILEDFMPIFNEQARILTKMLEKQRQEEDTFDICPFISRCALDVICETAMGEKINSQIGGGADYVQTVLGMTDILLCKGLSPWYRNPLIWRLTGGRKLETKYLKKMHDFTDRMIQDRKTNRKRKLIASNSSENVDESPEGLKSKRAFLDLLLNLQESELLLTDADIREEVDTFMFEGHDTTGANLDWTLMLLANNTDCQKLVHEELDRVFGDEMEREVTTTDLKQLKYLECCIKEALRLYPSVPFFLRRIDQDVALDEQRIIPKGVTAAISAYLIHRNPSVFPNPETFDPDRFSIENSVGRHPYAYIPFSAGPRNCIGQKFAMIEEKIILANVLRNFCIQPVDTIETAVAIPDIILRPKHGIQVRLVRRNK